MDISEICRKFETDIRSGCHPTVIEYGRSAAQKALMAAFKKNKATLKNIGDYISDRPSHTNKELEKSIQEAWEMLLSDMALQLKITHLGVLTNWARNHPSK